MNKKLIKTIASVTCGLGIASSVPFITTSCGSSENFTLIIKDVPSEVTGLVGVNNLGSMDLSNSVFLNEKPDQQVTKNLHFSINKGLPAGLSFDESLGKISGIPEEEASLENLKVTVIGTYNNKTLHGISDPFTLNITDGRLPDSVFVIGSNGELSDFSDDFINNPDNYKDYNTMQIPDSVKSVKYYMVGRCPDFIKYLSFSKNSQCTAIGTWGLRDCNFEEVVLPKILTNLDKWPWGSANLTKITWCGLDSTSGLHLIDNNLTFNNPKPTGTVQVYDGSLPSSELLSFLQGYGLPAGWIAA